jgi:hypothetical protein
MPAGRLGDEDDLGASRAVNLRTSIAIITLNGLAALRAWEFEIGHKFFIINEFALSYIIMSLAALPFKHLFGLSTIKRTRTIKMCFILSPHPLTYGFGRKSCKEYGFS